MKRNLMSVAITTLFAMPLPAAQIWEDPATGYRWCYELSGDAASVEINWEWGAPTRPKPTGNFTIPAQIDGLPVVGIGRNAFYKCDDMTALTMPDTITNIDDYAFCQCRDLERITLSSSLASIGAHAFSDCGSLTNLTIPSSVTNIDDYAFCQCRDLERITLSSSLASIGDYAFSDCGSLTNLTIPSSVVQVGGGFASSCGKLKTVIFQGSEIHIMSEPSELDFSGCTSLESYVLPDRITGVGGTRLDSDANGLVGVNFCGCSTLSNIVVSRSFHYASFGGCSNLVDISFPEGFMMIGNFNWNYFVGCDKLERATFHGKPPLGAYSFGDAAEGFLSLCLYTDAIYYPAKYEKEWKKVLRNIGHGGVSGIIGTEGTTIAGGSDARYELSSAVKDRAIASVTVDSDTALDDFLLLDGKVYDSVLRIVNSSDSAVLLSMPSGYEYEVFKGATPFVIPANSRNILSITRTAENVFLVTREELEVSKIGMRR